MEFPSHAKYARAKLDELIAEIEKNIQTYLDTEFGLLAYPYHEIAAFSVDVFKDIVMRPAKRLRGSFVLKSYEMFGGDNLKEAMKAAVAIEIVHAYLLVIDDFNDKSNLRRGKPTAHKMHESYHKERLVGDSLHYGNSAASVSGLFGMHHASNLILEIDLDPKIVIRALRGVNDAINVTAYGQIRDIYNQNAIAPTEADVLAVHDFKTAHYTYFNPIQMGATLAGATEDVIAKLKGYTQPAGVAFQIQDDILGVFGKPEKTGKSNMDDIMEGKTTLLTVKAFEKATKAQEKVLRSALGNKNLESNVELFKQVQEIIVETGSLDYSKKIAHKLVLEAKESIYKEFSDRSENDGFKFIAGIADYMIEREL